jgi:hypothetical protein
MGAGVGGELVGSGVGGAVGGANIGDIVGFLGLQLQPSPVHASLVHTSPFHPLSTQSQSGPEGLFPPHELPQALALTGWWVDLFVGEGPHTPPQGLHLLWFKYRVRVFAVTWRLVRLINAFRARAGAFHTVGLCTVFISLPPEAEALALVTAKPMNTVLKMDLILEIGLVRCRLRWKKYYLMMIVMCNARRESESAEFTRHKKQRSPTT